MRFTDLVARVIRVWGFKSILGMFLCETATSGVVGLGWGSRLGYFEWFWGRGELVESGVYSRNMELGLLDKCL